MGILHVLIERSIDSKVCYPYELLIVRYKEVLQVGRGVIERVFGTVVTNTERFGLTTEKIKARYEYYGECLGTEQKA